MGELIYTVPWAAVDIDIDIDIDIDKDADIEVYTYIYIHMCINRSGGQDLAKIIKKIRAIKVYIYI